MTPRIAPDEIFGRLHEDLPEVAVEVARRYASALTAPTVAVSACLLGEVCRYDGGSKPLADLERLLDGRGILPLCPEVLAGLGVPRPPMVFEGGDGVAALAGSARLVDENGRDCTALLAAGVTLALRLARAAGCESALLKARSPSCGVHQVHTESGLIEGCGMFTAACRKASIRVRSDERR
jgi:uncharacterized protein YbbK (DUF523 family)